MILIKFVFIKVAADKKNEKVSGTLEGNGQSQEQINQRNKGRNCNNTFVCDKSENV